MKTRKTGSPILNLAGKIAKMEAVKTNSGWPPACAGFLHQPKRPAKKQLEFCDAEPKRDCPLYLCNGQGIHQLS